MNIRHNRNNIYHYLVLYFKNRDKAWYIHFSCFFVDNHSNAIYWQKNKKHEQNKIFRNDINTYKHYICLLFTEY